MYNAGTAGSVFDLNAFSLFAEVGADVILFPFQEQVTVRGKRHTYLRMAESAIR
ncbi:hypothetical protein J2Y03_002296 [Neobacillus niacini]|nr:hypothetical protein [Neobacillus niacini]